MSQWLNDSMTQFQFFPQMYPAPNRQARHCHDSFSNHSCREAHCPASRSKQDQLRTAQPEGTDANGWNLRALTAPKRP